MSIKVFQTNANGKIEFTRCELEKLLNEIYNEGYRASSKRVPEFLDDNGAKATITTRRNNEAPSTYTVDLGKNFNLNSMTKALEEILSGYPKQPAPEGKTDPFTSLAKELSGV